jgi:hypothetical protein
MKRILTIFTLLMALATISKADTEDSIAMNNIGVGSQIVLKQPIRIEANDNEALLYKKNTEKDDLSSVACTFSSDERFQYSLIVTGTLTFIERGKVKTANNNTLTIKCTAHYRIRGDLSASIELVKAYLGDFFDIIQAPPQEY